MRRSVPRLIYDAYPTAFSSLPAPASFGIVLSSSSHGYLQEYSLESFYATLVVAVARGAGTTERGIACGTEPGCKGIDRLLASHGEREMYEACMIRGFVVTLHFRTGHDLQP